MASDSEKRRAADRLARHLETGLTRLGDVGTVHVWFTSVGQPAGCDLIAEEGEPLHLPGDVMGGDGPWWDLEGTLTGSEDHWHWEWNGEGRPTDHNANSAQRIVAFIDGDPEDN